MRNIQTLLIFVLATSFCLFAMADDSTNQIESAWIPPQNADPMKILAEARADIAAGQYTNALAKLIWFQQDTHKAEPLSFALNDWSNLDGVYQPALEKLKAIRDEAGKNVRNNNFRAFDNFLDFQEINEVFGEDQKTKELFIWLDANQPNLAKLAFDAAEPVLIEAKEFRLCGKYVDADNSFREILDGYQFNKQHAQSHDFGTNRLRFREYTNKSFIHRTTTLIALLVVNDRKKEAQQVADKISKESNIPEFKAEIQKALAGEIPPRWP